MLPRYFRGPHGTSRGGRGTPARPSSTHNAAHPSAAPHMQPLHRQYNPHASASAGPPAALGRPAPPPGSLLSSVRGPLALAQAMPRPGRVATAAPASTLVLDGGGSAAPPPAARSSVAGTGGVGAGRSRGFDDFVARHEASVRSLQTPVRAASQRRDPHGLNRRYTGLSTQVEPERVQRTPQAPASAHRTSPAQPLSRRSTATATTGDGGGGSGGGAQRLFTPSKAHVGGYSGRPDNSTASATNGWRGGDALRQSVLRRSLADAPGGEGSGTGAASVGDATSGRRGGGGGGGGDDEGGGDGDGAVGDASIRETDSALIAELFDDAIAETTAVGAEGRGSDGDGGGSGDGDGDGPAAAGGAGATATSSASNAGDASAAPASSGSVAAAPAASTAVDADYHEVDPAAGGVTAEAPTLRRQLSPTKSGSPLQVGGRTVSLIPWASTRPTASPFAADRSRYDRPRSSVPNLNPRSGGLHGSTRARARVAGLQQAARNREALAQKAESIQVAMLSTRCQEHEAAIEQLVEDRQRHRRDVADLKAALAEQTARAEAAEAKSAQLKAGAARLRGQVVNLEAELKQRLRQEAELRSTFQTHLEGLEQQYKDQEELLTARCRYFEEKYHSGYPAAQVRPSPVPVPRSALGLSASAHPQTQSPAQPRQRAFPAQHQRGAEPRQQYHDHQRRPHQRPYGRRRR